MTCHRCVWKNKARLRERKTTERASVMPRDLQVRQSEWTPHQGLKMAPTGSAPCLPSADSASEASSSLAPLVINVTFPLCRSATLRLRAIGQIQPKNSLLPRPTSGVWQRLPAVKPVRLIALYSSFVAKSLLLSFSKKISARVKDHGSRRGK